MSLAFMMFLFEFTYDNGWESTKNIQCSLDRALVATDWLTTFPDAQEWNLVREWSGHAPIKLTTCNVIVQSLLGTNRFALNNFGKKRRGAKS